MSRLSKLTVFHSALLAKASDTPPTTAVVLHVVLNAKNNISTKIGANFLTNHENAINVVIAIFMITKRVHLTP